MSNLFLDNTLWAPGDDTPADLWTGTAYQFTFDNPEGLLYFQLHFTGVAEEEDTIALSYNVFGIGPIFLNIVDNLGAVVSSTELTIEAIGSISLSCVAGERYTIVLADTATGIVPTGYATITGTLTPTADAARRPWWMCAPAAEPIVCPVRQTGFVSLADYDSDFKFPAASSRVAGKNPLASSEDCGSCAPTLITTSVIVVPPTPPIECATTTYTLLEQYVGDFPEYTGVFGSILNSPAFHTDNPTAAFYVRLPESSNPLATHYFYYDIGDEWFQMDWGNVLDFEGATTVTAEFGPSALGPWSCITLTQLAPQ